MIRVFRVNGRHLFLSVSVLGHRLTVSYWPPVLPLYARVMRWLNGR